MGTSGGISLQGYSGFKRVVAVAASGWILKLQSVTHWKHGYACLESGALTLVRYRIYVVVPFSTVIYWCKRISAHRNIVPKAKI
jgi:hypothetical protein